MILFARGAMVVYALRTKQSREIGGYSSWQCLYSSRTLRTI